MKLGRYNDFCKTVPNLPFDTFKPDRVNGVDWSLPDAVDTRSKRLPRLATPALWEDGKRGPKHKEKQISASARKRWTEDKRRYGQWTYEEVAMLHDGHGGFRHVRPSDCIIFPLGGQLPPRQMRRPGSGCSAMRVKKA